MNNGRLEAWVMDIWALFNNCDIGNNMLST